MEITGLDEETLTQMLDELVKKGRFSATQAVGASPSLSSEDRSRAAWPDAVKAIGPGYPLRTTLK